MLGSLLALVLFGGLLALILYRYQEKFIFFPIPLEPNYPFSQFRDFEEVYLPVDAQTKLHALFFEVANPKGVVLYFHGNARSLNDWGYAAQDLIQLGYSVLMPDYRTYGKSTGQLSEAALISDARGWYDWLAKRFEEKEIILYGRSLGSGVASQLALQVKARQLILETPYSSLLAVAKNQLPFAPVSWLLRYQLRTDLIVDDICCPIDLIHGTSDELIPYQQALDLAKGKAVLHTIPGGGHNNLAQFPQFHEILKGILRKRE